MEDLCHNGVHREPADTKIHSWRKKSEVTWWETHKMDFCIAGMNHGS